MGVGTVEGGQDPSADHAAVLVIGLGQHDDVLGHAAPGDGIPPAEIQPQLLAQQSQIRIRLASVLKTVVAQQLLPDVGGGMVPACEILHLNSAVSTMIRDNKIHQIPAAMASSGREGMITMDQAIARLYKEGHITRETALHGADKPENLERLL